MHYVVYKHRSELARLLLTHGASPDDEGLVSEALYHHLHIFSSRLVHAHCQGNDTNSSVSQAV